MNTESGTKTIKITYKKLAVRMLRDARLRINIGHNRMICFALGASVNKHRIEKTYGKRLGPAVDLTTSQLVDWIRTSLGGCACLEAWLEKNTTLDINATDYVSLKRSESKVRETRLAWVDWMIEELEKVK